MSNLWPFRAMSHALEISSEEVARLSDKDHPGALPKGVFGWLQERFNKNKFTLRRLERVASDYGVSDKDRYENKSFNSPPAIFLKWLPSLLNQIDRIDSARIPFEILPALTWAANDFLDCVTDDTKFDLVIRLSQSEGYSVTTVTSIINRDNEIDSASYKTSWKKYCASNAIKSNIAIITIPSAEANSILLHAMIVHELAHLKIFLHAEDRAQDEPYDSEVHFTKDLDTAIYHATSEGSAKRMQLIAWTDEVLCDLIASSVLGDGYLYASSRASLQHSTESSKSHPSRNFRIKLMVEFLASINSEFDVTADIFEYPEPSDRGDVDGEAIENILEIFKPLLFSAAIELGKNRHGIQQIAPKKDVLKNIADSFQNYVPYTGISLKNDPKSVWALISAGWYFRTHDTMFTDFVEAFYGSHPHRTTFSEAERRLDNLLLHSLRSLHLRSVVLTDTRLGND